MRKGKGRLCILLKNLRTETESPMFTFVSPNQQHSQSQDKNMKM